MAKIKLKSGVTLHYQWTGEGPDLVMIHGLTGNLAVWHLKMIPMLRDRYRVLTYDMRGHGYSDYPPSGYTVGDMSWDLQNLLDELGIDRTLIVGHSYGADTALYFALREPARVRQIIAIEAGIPATIHMRKREDWEGWYYWSKVLAHFGHIIPDDQKTNIDFLLRTSLLIPKVYGPASGRPRKPEPVLRLLETTMVQDYEEVGDLTLENIAKIKTRVNLIYGQDSSFIGTYHVLKDLLPNATGLVLPPTQDQLGGHFGVLEKPELLTEYILSYFSESAELPEVSGVTS